MSTTTFDFVKKQKVIKILGNEYDEKSIESFLKLITQIDNEKKEVFVKIIGNFDSRFLVQNITVNKSSAELDKILNMFQLISKTMQNSKIIFFIRNKRNS